ncbi:MAG TPA: hypothetical protein ENH10_02645 [Bacteroidetes bacterium]|nr:competence protein CoiA-like family protein [bacterium BMS3Bbin04]HDO64914.1 hypothetical protein [Bacteroidota bacterium]HEX04039.1 hypothetical protein [Bacteroidota bacterium]
MKESGFKIPYGENDGKMVHVRSVESGKHLDIVCPVCKGPLIARKGDKRSHHFAHATSSQQCSAESILHLTGKRLLLERISNAITNEEPLRMNWICGECGNTNEGDLGKKASSVESERMLVGCRPDICILDSSGVPVILVEVVVSHKPDDNVIRFVREKKCGLVEFHLSTEDDLIRLEDEILIPTKVHPCKHDSCRGSLSETSAKTTPTDNQDRSQPGRRLGCMSIGILTVAALITFVWVKILKK